MEDPEIVKAQAQLINGLNAMMRYYEKMGANEAHLIAPEIDAALIELFMRLIEGYEMPIDKALALLYAKADFAWEETASLEREARRKDRAPTLTVVH